VSTEDAEPGYSVRDFIGTTIRVALLLGCTPERNGTRTALPLTSPRLSW
jgi:hypothetical protein